jgi:hypothetical protein
LPLNTGEKEREKGMELRKSDELSILAVLFLENCSFFQRDSEHIRRGGFVDGFHRITDELMPTLVDFFESDPCPLHHFADVKVDFIVDHLLFAEVLLQFFVDLADADLGVWWWDELVEVDESVQLELLVGVEDSADSDDAFVAD